MLHAVVEGEPGMFPDPVARLLRGIGGLFRRGEEGERAGRRAPRPESDEAPSPDWEPKRPDDAPPPGA